MGLLERGLELATVGDWLDRVRAGRGGRLLVLGPAGIGKSAVVAALAEIARASGMVCLEAQASEIASRVAFGVARAALGKRWVEGDKPANAAREAVRAALELAERQPLVVAIDDVQWADAGSLRWLELLVTRAASAPVGVALAARTGADGADLVGPGQLLDDRGAIVVRPAPLSVEAAAELIGSRMGSRPDAALSHACHTETGGNPFLLLVLADALRQSGAPRGPGARTRLREIGARAVSRSVARRLERIDPEARRLVEAIAVVGDIGGLAELAAVAEVALPLAAEAVQRLAELDLLASGGELEMAHPLVGAAVRAQLGVAPRQELAWRAAGRLRAAGRVEEAAARLADLPPRANPAVAEQLAEAAQVAAARGAPGVAATLLRRALAEPPPVAARAEMQAALGRALLSSGEPEALGALRTAFDHTPPGAAAASVATSLAMALNYARRTQEAAAVLDQARAALDPADAALGEELEAMTIHYLSFDPTQRPERARRLAHWSHRRGTSELAYRMRLAECATDSVVEARPAGETVSLAEQALAGGILLTREFPAFAQAVLALAYGGKPAAARVHLRDAVADARRRGDTVAMGFALALQGEARRLEGDVAAVESDTRTALELLPAGELGPRFVLRGLIESLVDQGRVADAEQELRAGALTGELPSVLPTVSLLHARARARIASGATALGVGDLLLAGGLAERLGLRDPLSVPWRLAAAESLAALGDRQRAEVLVTEHLQLARRRGLPEAIGPAMRVQGLLTGGPAGLRQLEEAVALLEGGFAQLDLAWALVDLGTAFLSADPARAPTVLERGADLAAQLGASALAARAKGLLTPTGAGASRTLHGAWPVLSTGEHQVARLAAEGMSQREIADTLVLTERTVELRLSEASRKLAARAGAIRVRQARGRNDLSVRELEVLRMLATSLTMAEIASALYVSRNTLKTHCRSVYRRLDVRSRAQAVARGRATGLLPDHPG